MRTHTYWKTYEECSEWSSNSPKKTSLNGVYANGVSFNGGYGGVSPVGP